MLGIHAYGSRPKQLLGTPALTRRSTPSRLLVQNAAITILVYSACSAEVPVLSTDLQVSSTFATGDGQSNICYLARAVALKIDECVARVLVDRTHLCSSL